MEKELETGVEEKDVNEEKETEHVEEPVENEEALNNAADENQKSEPTPADLIKQQALQAEYVEKMNALLNKNEITDEDIQTVDFVKSELLSQLVGVAVFSSTLGMDDSKIKGADALSTHITNVYVKAALLREKMERKRLAQLEKMDVADAYFGPNQEGSNAANKVTVITDMMLLPRDHHQLTVALSNSSPQLAAALNLVEFAKDPEARLTAMMPDLMQEFKDKTTADEQKGFSAWAEKIVSGLAQMNSKGSMMTALQGVKLGQTLARVSGANELAG